VENEMDLIVEQRDQQFVWGSTGDPELVSENAQNDDPQQ